MRWMNIEPIIQDAVGGRLEWDELRVAWKHTLSYVK